MNDYIARELLGAVERLIEVQQRIAAADERRNELLWADQQERREAWRTYEQDRAKALDALVDRVPEPGS